MTATQTFQTHLWRGSIQVTKRFLEKVEYDTNVGCWWWSGKPDKNGYGRLKYNNKMHKAHRLSYELHKGIIPNGLLVRHICHNPSCVNPEHLCIGTAQDNSNDMTRANRQAKGSSNGRSKLVESDIPLIKGMLSKKISQEKIADIFNINRVQVSSIKLGKTWKHTPINENPKENS